ncbi:unnamed protein product, partial [Medioppia subpectinata]
MEITFETNDKVLLLSTDGSAFGQTVVDTIGAKVNKNNLFIKDINNLSASDKDFDVILSSVQQIEDKILVQL